MSFGYGIHSPCRSLFLFFVQPSGHASSGDTGADGGGGGGGGDPEVPSDWSMDSVLLLLAGVMMCVVAMVVVAKAEGGV